MSAATKAEDAGSPRLVQVNAHTHLYSGLAPFGMPAPAEPPQNFVEILQRVWWRLDRALDERSLRASARLYLAEALLSGTGALIDHHESPNFVEGSLEVLADAATELGVRLAVCYGVSERNEGPTEAARGLAECERFLKENRRPLVKGMVGVHASFTVSDDTLAKAGALARGHFARVHVHVAEDRADVVDAQKRGHAGPLERLLALGALPAGSILAHGVHLSPAAIRLVNENGLWIVQNPRSNEGNRVGYPAQIPACERVALGTDGYPADMEAETAALFRLGIANQDPEAHSKQLGRRVEGSRRLAKELFGPSFTLENDFAVLDATSEGGTRAHEVTVAGRAVVVGGKLARADIEEIRARAKEEAARLWRAMQALS